jgi:hypothetical protein
MGMFGPIIVHTSAVLGTSTTTLQASPENIGYAGVSPTTISLNWTEDTNSTFVQYVIQESTLSPSGPWVTIQNIPVSTTTTYYYNGLSPGTLEWWQVIYYDTLSHPSDNVLEVTQPSVAFLSSSQPTATSIRMEWNNLATYGGLVSFSSYRLMESVNNGPYQLEATIGDVNVFSYTVDGLSPATSYSLYLNTTDECSCSPSSPSSSASNSVSVTTPGLLTATAFAEPTIIDAGQSVLFTCYGVSGVPLYTYSWAFGDGGMGVGADPSHTYTILGTMSAACTVVDQLGTQTVTSVVINVFSDPQVRSPTAQPSSVDVGQSATLTSHVIGGWGGYTYLWSNLPRQCDNANTASISCNLTAAGTFPIAVSVTDSTGFTVDSSVLYYVVYPDPSIASFEATPTTVSIGQTVSFVVIASGGNSSLQYSYSNLPSGCRTMDVSSIACTPTSSGDYRVTVTISDRAGKSATTTLDLDVAPSRVLGLPHDLGLAVSYGITGTIAATVIIVVPLALRRRKG